MLKGFNYYTRLRQAQGLSEEEMAQMLRISVDRLQQIERSSVQPPPEMFVTYANALRITVEELLAFHLNTYAAEFCAKVGIGRRIQFYFEEDPCGLLLGVEARSKFDRKQGNSLRPSVPRKITASTPSSPTPTSQPSEWNTSSSPSTSRS